MSDFKIQVKGEDFDRRIYVHVKSEEHGFYIAGTFQTVESSTVGGAPTATSAFVGYEPAVFDAATLFREVADAIDEYNASKPTRPLALDPGGCP